MIQRERPRTYDRPMRLIRGSIATLLTALVVAAPAQAGKVKVYAPPGKAGTSQYSEIVPAAGGNTQTPAMGGGNPTAAQISHVGQGRAGVRKLATLGKSGAAAAQFAQATAPSVVVPRHGLGGVVPRTRYAALTAASGDSAAGGVWRVLGGSDTNGIGVFLPLLLAFGLGAAVTATVIRLLRHRFRGAPRI